MGKALTRILEIQVRKIGLFSVGTFTIIGASTWEGGASNKSSFKIFDLI